MTRERKLILVGSLNPVKINAVREAAIEYWEKCEVKGIKTPSGVSDMPLSKQETRIGAKNRAKHVIQQNNEATLGVGLEGGICKIDGDWYLFGTTYCTNGITGSWGGETLMKLPSKITEKIGDGTIELGYIIDDIVGTENIKQKEGAVGYLSNNIITRTDVFRMSIKMSLAPFIEIE